jgi:hypothetical protein
VASDLIIDNLKFYFPAKPSASFYEKTFWAEEILQTIGEGTKQ